MKNNFFWFISGGWSLFCFIQIMIKNDIYTIIDKTYPIEKIAFGTLMLIVSFLIKDRQQ